MKKNTNYEDLLFEIREMLEGLVADKLDVNRRHIDVRSVELHPLVVLTCDTDPDFCETYYHVIYRTRYWNEKKKEFKYGEPADMVWVHNEDADGVYDCACTMEEYNSRMEDCEDDE